MDHIDPATSEAQAWRAPSQETEGSLSETTLTPEERAAAITEITAKIEKLTEELKWCMNVDPVDMGFGDDWLDARPSAESYGDEIVRLEKEIAELREALSILEQ